MMVPSCDRETGASWGLVDYVGSMRGCSSIR
jgi:hypothetical protein